MEGTDADDAELLAHADEVAQDGPAAADGGARVISLHARRLPPDPRQGMPDMSKYDRLLNLGATREASQNQKGRGA